MDEVGKGGAVALLGLDLDVGEGPAFRRLAEQIRRAIRSGALLHGTRLPASRQLAAQLGIARNSVVEAYAELAAEGLAEGLGRNGTQVAMVGKRSVPVLQAALPTVLQRLPQVHAPCSGHLNWKPGQTGTQALPLEIWRSACREAGRHLPPAGYGDPYGDIGLRQALADWLRRQRAVRVDATQIVITQGSSQALELIGRALLQPGDCCCVEDPGYPLAALAWGRAGAAIRYAALDSQGLLPAPAFSGAAPLLLHTTPAHQYPLGMRMPGPRRRELLAAAQAHGTLIVENEYDYEFIHAGQGYPPLFASAPERVLLVSTFAKAISPALRLGFIAGPPVAISAIAALLDRERLHVSWPTQQILAWLLSSGELDKHLRRVRRHYAAMRASILAAMAPMSGFVVTGHEGGLHVLVRGTSPSLDAALLALLHGQGVLFDAAGSYTVLDQSTPGLLFAYGHMDEAMLEQSLRVLTAAMQRAGDSR